jgi:DNA-binding LacI/PurR family transcriptional regulator
MILPALDAIISDVAVMGYDDIDLAALVDPALSTVRIAKTRLGQVAARVLMGMIGHTEKGADQLTFSVLAPQLVVRETS